MTKNKLLPNKVAKTAPRQAVLGFITALSLLPTLALAHPGHGILAADGSFFSSILSGVMHPLTGLDHLMLALGMGILFTQMNRFKKGLASLSIGLIAGFLLSLTLPLNSVYVEAGIVLSIVLLTLALMSRYFNPALNTQTNSSINKMYSLAIVGFGALAMSHGAAHALEVPSNSITTGFFIGMIAGMVALYSVGHVVANSLNKQLQNSLIIQRIMAVLGLCAVLFN